MFIYHCDLCKKFRIKHSVDVEIMHYEVPLVNSSIDIPMQVYNIIIKYSESHPLYGDISWYRSNDLIYINLGNGNTLVYAGNIHVQTIWR